MEIISWMIVLAVLILIEIATLSLTTIWFAAGALAACITAMFDAPVLVQSIVFIVVSVVVLFLVRPSAVKYFNKNRIKTNYEGIIGVEAKVIEKVDNNALSGMAIVNGQEWTARAVSDDIILDEGTKARVVNISGVKLILSNEKEELKEEKQ